MIQMPFMYQIIFTMRKKILKISILLSCIWPREASLYIEDEFFNNSDS